MKPVKQTFDRRGARAKARRSPPCSFNLLITSRINQEFHPLKSLQNCLDNGEHLICKDNEMNQSTAALNEIQRAACYCRYLHRQFPIMLLRPRHKTFINAF